jgi:hypothetical protein
MGWEYTNADRQLTKSNRIRIRINNAVHGGPIHGCGTGVGENGRVGANNPEGRNVDIEFQFPPKVLTDGRKGNWEEGELPGGQEPIAVFVTSGPRELTLSWTYIIDSHDTNSNSWTIDRVTRNIRTLRGYFANVRDSDVDRDGLVVGFHMWCIGGTAPITARIKSIDVKYGETMVFPPRGGLSDRAFPLRTDITVELRVWTKGLRRASEAGGVDEDLDDDLGMQHLKALAANEPPDWY